jgi:hypothetical protein
MRVFRGTDMLSQPGCEEERHNRQGCFESGREGAYRSGDTLRQQRRCPELCLVPIRSISVIALGRVAASPLRLSHSPSERHDVCLLFGCLDRGVWRRLLLCSTSPGASQAACEGDTIARRMKLFRKKPTMW